MGGSSKQTIGYKYFGGLMVVIGNRIEKLLNIRPDDRRWVLKNRLDGNTAIIDEPDLFGGDNSEGGWVGLIDMHLGADNQEQNKYLARHVDKNISSYPNLSYLVFRGVDVVENQYSENLDKGFQLVSMSGMMKDFMLWVKRTRIKNNGQDQWYKVRADGEIVCEIDAERLLNIPTPLGNCSFYYKYTQGCSFDNDLAEVAWSKNFTKVVDEPTGEYPKGDFVPDPTGSSSEPRPGCLTSYTSERKNGHYEFKHIYNGGGFVVVSIDFHVPKGDASGVDLYTENEVQEIRDIENGKITYVFRDRAPCEISAIWKVKSIKTNSEVSPWLYSYGLGFFYMHQTDKSSEMQAVDINPIHKIREILTDDTAMNKSELLINDDNFKIMADRIWDEGLGISWCIQEKSCKEALDELCYHIEGGLRINRETGLYEVILFRDDMLNLDSALKFNESNIKTINFDVINFDEIVSSINVSYYDRPLIKNSSFLLYENGIERTRGFAVSDNVDFQYFQNRDNAEKVGNWKLKQMSTPAFKGSLKTGIIEARKINKYDVIKLSWKNKNLIDLPVRVMNINLGDGVNNTVTIDFVEVIPYSNIEYSKTHVDEPTVESLPPQPNINTAFEMPYFEAAQRFTQTAVDTELLNNNEIGYLIASAAKPQNNSMNAHLYTDIGSGDINNMQRVGMVDYCPVVELASTISQVDTVLKIKDIDRVQNSGVANFSGATSGTWILLNNEIMVYQSFNDATKEITVKRGALDTVPQKHNSGTIFFSDEFSGIDSNQYLSGETVQYKVLTTTPSGLQESNSVSSVLFNSRAIRPYPPANVKINGEYYPSKIDNSLTITWVDRNRLQQTGGDILGWTDGNINIEQNTSTKIIILEEDSLNNILATHNNDVTVASSYTLPISALNAETRYLNITAKTIRDGFDSYQSFTHKVELSLFFSAPYDITVEFKND